MWTKLLRSAYLRIPARVQLRSLSTSCVYLQDVRVRFGPSPTGFMHLGGLRTALYNYIFAKANNGKFVLRIEDTDQSRLVQGATKNIEDMLEWSGLSPDEGPTKGGDFGPYKQSERLQTYQHHTETLLQNGTAYRCFCTPQRIELIRKEAVRSGQVPRYDNRCRHLSTQQVQEKLHKGMTYTIRFKLDDADGFDDIVFGHNIGTAAVEGDPVLLKSDGWPTYHLANVIDDHLMQITHVLRGTEWLGSTSKHLSIYKAFNWTPPTFAHLPLIINKDGSKLSKRQGDLFVDHLRNSGYLPEAVVNFLTYCGGGFPDGHEINTLQQLIQKFDINEVRRQSAVLEMELLDQVNRGHILQLLETSNGREHLIADVRHEVLHQLPARYGESLKLRDLDDDYLGRILMTNKHRINRIRDLTCEEFDFLWRQPNVTVETLLEISPQADNILSCVHQAMADTPSDSFSKGQLVENLKSIHKSSFPTEAMGSYMKLLRMALSGLKQGPGVAEMMELLGKEEVSRRLKEYYDSKS
ncbi:nondiscriminating glutamyl-tRNA synthetase EARS2, mitochondrial-like [Amphiura filiformis]|uniref:nondiscriminating glutamyl-tRNA synthetase EARS2, mitochondrial-like n=1 Tax=Amphiura filiformis TaxID=82378 RepID=UPI003B2205FA